MPDYTKKNLKTDVKDSAPGFGFAPDLEAHFAAGDLELNAAGMAYERLAPGKRAPFGHMHKEQEEIYVVVEGSGRIKVDDEILDLELFDAIRIGPGLMRRTEAGPDGLGIIAFGAPPVEGDKVAEAPIDPDWWAE
jgi:quercetin dioxygenase-like cupin family protein